MTEQQIRELVKDLDFALDFTEPLEVILKRFEDILRPHFASAGAAHPLDTPQELSEARLDEIAAKVELARIVGVDEPADQDLLLLIAEVRRLRAASLDTPLRDSRIANMLSDAGALLAWVEYRGDAGGCPKCGGRPHMPVCRLRDVLGRITDEIQLAASPPLDTATEPTKAEVEVARLKAAMNKLGDELRLVSVRLCNSTIGEGDIQRMLADTGEAPTEPTITGCPECGHVENGRHRLGCPRELQPHRATADPVAGDGRTRLAPNVEELGASHPLDTPQEFCRACGASIPHRRGEGRCPKCAHHHPDFKAASHPLDTGAQRCDHKFVDSDHCLKCGWSPRDAPSDTGEVSANDVRHATSRLDRGSRRRFAASVRSPSARGTSGRSTGA